MQNSQLIRSSSITSTEQFTSDNVFFAARGVMGVATAGTVSNIDLKIPDDAYFTGGVLIVAGATLGDFVNMQVVDVDGIMAPPGYVLAQYATNWYMQTGQQEQLDIEHQYPGKLIAGLYLRMEYHSVGTVNPTVIANYFLHKTLY